MNQHNNSQGLVDVVIPAYNAARYIEETLYSAAAQGDILANIIVVNDGSSDNTASLVVSFAASHPNFSVQVINQENMGLSAARNTGIKASTAPFIAFLDADDIWLPEKLNKQLAVFDQSKDDRLGLVYCAYGAISESSIRLPKVTVVPPKLRGDIYRNLLHGNFISGSGSAVLIKRSVFDEVGLFDEKLRAGEDWDMWLRIAKIFHVDYCPKKLVFIRLHGTNMQKDKLRMLTSDLMILNKFVLTDQMSYFLLWKIRTYLINCKMQASEIPGFDLCTPDLQKMLSGTRMKLAALVLAPFSLAAKTYFNLKSLKRRRL